MKGKRVVLFRFTGVLRGAGVIAPAAGVLVVAVALVADNFRELVVFAQMPYHRICRVARFFVKRVELFVSHFGCRVETPTPHKWLEFRIACHCTCQAAGDNHIIYPTDKVGPKFTILIPNELSWIWPLNTKFLDIGSSIPTELTMFQSFAL